MHLQLLFRVALTPCPSPFADASFDSTPVPTLAAWLLEGVEDKLDGLKAKVMLGKSIQTRTQRADDEQKGK